MIKRKKPLKRTPIKRKPYKIRKVSIKRAEDNIKYSRERTAFLSKEENKICNAKWECNGNEAVDVHHKEGRGEHLLDVATWIAVCRKCHNRITEDSKGAIERGLSVSRIKRRD